MNRPLGLYCLLYLSADRILPTSGGTGTSLWTVLKRVYKTSVPVPCRPTVEVVQRDLESRLLMAALLECWEMGRVQLRLAEPSDTRWKDISALVTGVSRWPHWKARPSMGFVGESLSSLSERASRALND